LERRKREERKKNLIIRELEIKERKRKEAVEEQMKVIGVEFEIKEAWKIVDKKEKEREMIGIKVEGIEKRREIMEKDVKRRERKEKHRNLLIRGIEGRKERRGGGDGYKGWEVKIEEIWAINGRGLRRKRSKRNMNGEGVEKKGLRRIGH